MERIRQGNVGMALVVIGLAALWLTPVLDAERISANSQLARFEAGRTAVADLDVAALQRWGVPGERVLATLAERAKAPGQEALAAVLAGEAPDDNASAAAAAAALAAVMPVQPATATGTRDTLLASAADYMLADWQAVCDKKLEDGGPGCLMVVADLLPSVPGEEGLVILERSADNVEVVGLYLGQGGMLVTRQAMRPDGSYLGPDAAAGLLRAWRAAPPPLTPALINQLGTGDTGLMMLP
jgi:hypothetical protein